MKGMTYRNDKTGEATVEHTCDARAAFDKLAIIVVTYKRQQLLEELLASFAQLTVAPWHIVIVDNEHSDETQDMVDEFREKADGLWGTTDADRKGGTSRVVYAPQTDNLGGAGGFSVGVKVAYDLGAEWFWVMDDDVAVLPDGIEKLAKWGRDHDVIQGGKLDFDGGPFYWQYNFIVPLGIPNPIAPAAFGSAGYRVMNTLCFEGGLFRRRIVEKIGLPDPRFFIYWDDTMYGYLASKVTNSIVVPDVVMRRTRDISNWDIAGLRQLNSTSDMNRYHILRNRGYMARYFMMHGDYRPVLFALGTAATVAKEVIRLVAVDREHVRTGLVQIAKGWRDSHKLMHDPKWRLKTRRYKHFLRIFMLYLRVLRARFYATTKSDTSLIRSKASLPRVVSTRRQMPLTARLTPSSPGKPMASAWDRMWSMSSFSALMRAASMRARTASADMSGSAAVAGSAVAPAASRGAGGDASGSTSGTCAYSTPQWVKFRHMPSSV